MEITVTSELKLDIKDLNCMRKKSSRVITIISSSRTPDTMPQPESIESKQITESVDISAKGQEGPDC
jgi:hypothetical protein